MRGAGLWVVAGLAPVLVGLIAWGIVDGRSAARPWRACEGPPEGTPAAERLAACDAAIKGGRVSAYDLPEAYSIRGELLIQLKDYPTAVANYDKALALAPDDGFRHNSACWVRAVAGRDLDRARELCDRGIEILAEWDDDQAEVLDSRGLVGLKQGRFADALADYDKAVKLSDRPHYRYGRGIAALRRGLIEQGEADIAKARSSDNETAQAYETYGVRP